MGWLDAWAESVVDDPNRTNRGAVPTDCCLGRGSAALLGRSPDISCFRKPAKRALDSGRWPLAGLQERDLGAVLNETQKVACG